MSARGRPAQRRRSCSIGTPLVFSLNRVSKKNQDIATSSPFLRRKWIDKGLWGCFDVRIHRNICNKSKRPFIYVIFEVLLGHFSDESERLYGCFHCCQQPSGELPRPCRGDPRADFPRRWARRPGRSEAGGGERHGNAWRAGAPLPTMRPARERSLGVNSKAAPTRAEATRVLAPARPSSASSELVS